MFTWTSVGRAAQVLHLKARPLPRQQRRRTTRLGRSPVTLCSVTAVRTRPRPCRPSRRLDAPRDVNKEPTRILSPLLCGPHTCLQTRPEAWKSKKPVFCGLSACPRILGGPPLGGPKRQKSDRSTPLHAGSDPKITKPCVFGISDSTRILAGPSPRRAQAPQAPTVIGPREETS